MMNNRRTSLWLSLVRAYVELVFYLPLALAASHYLLPASQMLWWIITLPIVYGAWAAILRENSRIRVFVRVLLALLLGFAHSLLTAVLTGTEWDLVPIAACGLLGALFADRGFIQWRAGWSAAFSSFHMVIGVGAYIAMQPIKLLALKELADYSFVWNIGAVVSILLFFILANERHLNSESVDAHNSPTLKASKRLNRLWIGLLLGLIGFLMIFRQLREWVEETLRSFFQSLFSGIEEEPPKAPEPEPMPEPQGLPPMEPQKESWFMNMLELVLQVAAYMLVAAAAIAVIYLFVKYVYRGILALIQKLSSKERLKQEEEGAYTDEVESLVDSKFQWRKRSRREKTRDTGWDELTSNAERIRYLYKTWLQTERERGYEAKPYLSPRETALEAGASAGERLTNEQSSFIQLYEEARYGEREPSGEAVSQHRIRLEHERKRK
ncbi:DUF4129 domain-containing protein [Paenibacillus nanensis]|uniref:DUF4129 domain-containing protein n=1 Tax=Paenibacillus nanensis TaxID=393251 RepID=A0A3A1UYK7_9BACL|nr:DUF4129 domain-containing protein [Paenibacillus nanensis]RIX53639.1 DUF4129 domain-containing protein [Paenibacillus nanensis]